MSRRIPLAAGHIKDGELTLVATTDDDLREMAVCALQDALDRAAKRWAAAAQEYGAALYARDGGESARARSTDLVAAQANYRALARASFRAIAQAMHEAGASVVEVRDVS